MRVLLVALTSYCALVASPAIAAQECPYKAYMTADDVYVRSGPGESYYPTDKLKRGQEVEVYRHDPGGWYAIKPPEGSFTWVSARYLKAGVDNLAVVTDDRVAARVGSRFSNIRDIIQVRLHKGEVVEVLERKQTGSASDRKTWYKIGPPSGEFRWVFGKYVDPDYAKDGLRKTRPLESAVTPVDAPDAERLEPRPQQSDQELPPVATRQPTDTSQEPIHEPIYEPVEPRQITPEQYRAEIERLELELSVMVVEEPTVWEFDEMRQRVGELLAQAETALERGRARVLIGKMTRFEDIKRRHGAVHLVRRETERSNRRLAALGRSDRHPDRREPSEGRFDGVGELTRVVSPNVGAPRYALVDDAGGVRCYVTPAPGMNLRYYIGRRVGVTGTRGYMPEQRAHHVMARHVNTLDGRKLW